MEKQTSQIYQGPGKGYGPTAPPGGHGQDYREGEAQDVVFPLSNAGGPSAFLQALCSQEHCGSLPGLLPALCFWNLDGKQ
ncbi:hypothetical protein COCON_G00189490 [Conger conger]|uniref:Uncharacterized protein n=1 Tax=Conger conger TaxID=82655 RepID=A0A9Q1D3I5_CONCO|nr:hypothetical protein COCON_G00189490 [Conger conger]